MPVVTSEFYRRAPFSSAQLAGGNTSCDAITVNTVPAGGYIAGTILATYPKNFGFNQVIVPQTVGAEMEHFLAGMWDLCFQARVGVGVSTDIACELVFHRPGNIALPPLGSRSIGRMFWDTSNYPAMGGSRLFFSGPFQATVRTINALVQTDQVRSEVVMRCVSALDEITL